MEPDSILEETWRTKDDLAREADYDVGKVFQMLRAHEQADAGAPRIRQPEDLRRLRAKSGGCAPPAMALGEEPPPTS
ncbi:MAG: hypothetical protein N3I86_04065 [Verrucomicrobiae bacterium]|nr:hypothetical protein [Verrucomicrobiae bacterium]MDW8307875.1 hypothetical protein [Verrucomicrobiales bacterium]